MTRRSCVTALFVALTLACAGVMAQGTYPARPIRLIVPWTAAGTVDIVARQLGERLSARMGQPVIVDNRAGATGQIGSQMVVQATPDGHTLLVMSATVHTVSPNVLKSFPFDPVDDFTPISQIVSFPYAMVVAGSGPLRSVADLLAAARKEPGRHAYGSFGPGSAPYVITEYFAMRSGVKLNHVPYKGAAQAITDVIGGQITLFVDSLPSPLPHVRGGRLRALAVTTAQRSSHVPDVPTLAETVPGFEAIAWLGIAAPRNTPRAVATRLHEELRQIAAEPEYAGKLRAIGLDPVASPSPQEFRAWLVAQRKYWAEFVRTANIPLVAF